jgi:hypothetical protein
MRKTFISFIACKNCWDDNIACMAPRNIAQGIREMDRTHELCTVNILKISVVNSDIE